MHRLEPLNSKTKQRKCIKQWQKTHGRTHLKATKKHEKGIIKQTLNINQLYSKYQSWKKSKHIAKKTEYQKIHYSEKPLWNISDKLLTKTITAGTENTRKTFTIHS